MNSKLSGFLNQFRFPSFNKAPMFTKIIAATVTVALMTGILITFNPFWAGRVSAGEYRDGFQLTPTDSDATGISPDTSFILKTRVPVTKDELTNNLTIEGEPAPIIEELEDNSFKITPSKPFEHNKLYTFSLKRNNLSTIQWTFQTSAPFNILGCFPADAATGVPVNTGIEIYFSHEDYGDLENYFEITPKAEGHFERHKRAAVFVPKELEPGTLYQVRIKKGLPLKNTNYKLNEDYIFMFETRESGSSTQSKGYFNYNEMINEFSTTDTPLLPFYFYVNDYSLIPGPREDVLYSLDLGTNENDPEKSGNIIEVETSVYNYKDADSFIHALAEKSSIPPWAYVSYQESKVDSTGLEKVLDFKQKFETRPRGQQYIMIPQTLPAGFYLVESKWQDIIFQTFLEITDIGMYITKSEKDVLVWLNDIATGEPIEGAVIELFGENLTYSTDKDGTAMFKSPALETGNKDNQDYFKFYKVQKGDKISVFYLYAGNYSYSYNNMYDYWSFLETDRSLYKPDDTVYFWGFLKPRYGDETIGSVTVEVNQNYYIPFYETVGLRYLPTNNQPFAVKTVELQNGTFHGEIELPSLEPGGYQLTLKHGTDVIAKSYLSIENYVKPIYKIEISKDKEAVFSGEEVTFTVKALFFEGTPVPGLDVEYNIYSGIGASRISGKATTDDQGVVTVKYKAEPVGDVQGERYSNIYVRSSLPEMGDVSAQNQVRVFVNDINVKFSTDYQDDKGIITAEVNEIVLDRINSGTNENNSDYIGNPLQGVELKGTLYKNTWIEIEDGEYYDFINKVTQKRYRHELKQEPVKNFTIITGGDGKGTFEFESEPPEKGYYSATLNCTDGNGRNMHFEVHIGSYYYWNTDYDYYTLDGIKDNYKIGEEVRLEFKKGEETLDTGKFLFIKSQNGIREYVVQDSPVFSFNMKAEDVPNIYVSAAWFNGISPVEAQYVNIHYDYEEKNMILKLEKDKESYAPGEEVTIKIKATDKDGIPQKATVNASIVDEALFKLRDKLTDVLADLYSFVPSGIQSTYCSHQNSGQNVTYDSTQIIVPTFGGTVAGGRDWARNTMELASEALMDGFFDSDSGYVRSDFRDTAYFKTITLDASGYGELRFKLPDNVTSWRVTLAGVSEDLTAGSDKYELNVSLPFFINYTMNTSYLTGDEPVLGVSAYGNDLNEGDKVYFEVSGAGKTVFAEGKAFERVNIPLWKLEYGLDQEIVITASTGKHTDSLKHVFDVVDSYHIIDRAEVYTLKPHLDFEGGKTGNTKLIFTDNSRGAFLPELTSLLYTNGNRIDQKLTEQLAYKMIKDYFNQDNMKTLDSSFKISDYQTADGGIAILPYGSSDPDISAKLLSFIRDDINQLKLKQYFYSLLYGNSPGLKGNALYGLALLREPVLLELDKAVQVRNAHIKDIIYIALAYFELGETPKAQALYDNVISKHMERLKPLYRIKTGKDHDDIIECTALAAVLAAKLDKPEKEGLYLYSVRNATKDILVNIERLLYIQNEIEKRKNEVAEFSYTLNGQSFTRVLKDGESFTLTIPSAKLDEFDITDVKGNVAMVSMFKNDSVSTDKISEDIFVNRTYYSLNGEKTSSFKQHDIVKVVLDWDIKETAIDGGYEITDYLPSGLVPIDNPLKAGVENETRLWYRNIDGQKVTFYAWKNTKNKQPFTYYARVISPGKYKAEAPIIQSTVSNEVIYPGKTDRVEIK